MLRRILIILLLPLISQMSFAQSSNLRQARSLLKDSKIAEAEKAIQAAQQDENTVNQAATWDLAGRIQLSKVESELVKAYLKQSYDTITIYNGVLEMTQDFLRCDSLAQASVKKGVNKYRKNNSKSILTEKNNLITGGIYFYNKSEGDLETLKRARLFFSTYIDMANSPMMANENLNGNDSVFTRTAYYITLISAELNDYQSVTKYANYARNNNNVGKYALTYLAEAYNKLGNYESQLNTLKEGVELYPEDDTFFANLIDFYINHKNYSEAMAFTGKMLNEDNNNFFYHYIKGFLLQSTKEYDKALASYDQAIKINPNYAEAFSNQGLIYCLQVDELKEDSQEDINAFYLKAKDAYETARKLRPDNKSLWADGLYRVYFNLHLGEQFQEIESIITGE